MHSRLHLAAVLLLATAPGAKAQDAFAPRAGVLVLRNGNIVEGEITRLGDRYVVLVGESSEVRFPAGDVDFQCGSLEEAYLRKLELLDSTSIRQRLDLAEWSVRHGLTHRGADQLLAALAINPFDARAHALRRRLIQMSEARQIAQAPSRSSEVDWQAIDRVLQTTPAEAVEKFTTGVQLLLVNRCGTNACHGSQANSEFRLMRPLKDKTLPRRLTQRNLYATLAWIDPADPDASPLLTIPRGPHGGEKQGLFAGKQDAQWVQLRDWVRLAAQPREPSFEAEAAAAQIPTDVPSGERSALRPATAELSAGEIHRSLYSQSPAKEAAASPARDPFDPEIFNRRYHPEKSTPSIEKVPLEATSRN
jgi:hypothetical protein